MCMNIMNIFYGENNMGLINDLEKMELLQIVKEYGFNKGCQLYWIFRYKNLPENQNKSRRQLEHEIVEVLRLCSFSSFQKLMALYNKYHSNLMSREIKDRITLLEK